MHRAYLLYIVPATPPKELFSALPLGREEGWRRVEGGLKEVGGGLEGGLEEAWRRIVGDAA